MLDPRLQWFRCYPARLLGALAGMSAPEKLTYLVVLLRIYETNGSCPDTDDAIARRTGLTKATVAKALLTLEKSGRLRKLNDGFHNPIADQVMAEQREFNHGRSMSAKKAIKARWEKHQSKQQSSNTTRIRERAESESEIESQTPQSSFLLSPVLDSESSLNDSANGFAGDFSTFWKCYPKKKDKGHAEKAFRRAIKLASLGTMLAALERQKPTWADPKFIPYPATWLNGQRWEDEVTTHVNGGTDERRNGETLGDLCGRLADAAREREAAIAGDPRREDGAVGGDLWD